jgi:hypothetical protein
MLWKCFAQMRGRSRTLPWQQQMLSGYSNKAAAAAAATADERQGPRLNNLEVQLEHAIKGSQSAGRAAAAAAAGACYAMQTVWHL